MARIVYVGRLFEGSSAVARAEALEALGHQVTRLDSHPAEPGLRRLQAGLRRKTGLGPAHPANGALVAAVGAQRAEVLWVDKGLNVTRAALEAAAGLRPGLIRIHYSLDDHRIPGNRSVDLVRALPAYDLAVTTKSFNLDWLAAAGARRPHMSWQGFDPAVHRPPGPGEADATLAGRIVLVGAWEPERAELTETMARAGLPVTVLSAWKQWEASARRCPALEWRRWEVYGRAYALAIGSAAVALGVLRRAATDLHTQRSVEIPACGTALLAERTDEHAALFREGAEAEFYASVPEAVEKARGLLADPIRREQLAAAGRARCLEGGYSWVERVRQILEAAGASGAA